MGRDILVVTMGKEDQSINRDWEKRPDGNYIGSILESLEEKVENGEITIREAAIKLHKAGWTNFIDEDKTKRLLNM